MKSQANIWCFGMALCLWFACGILLSVLVGYITGNHTLKSWDPAGGNTLTEMAPSTMIVLILFCVREILREALRNGHRR